MSPLSRIVSLSLIIYINFELSRSQATDELVFLAIGDWGDEIADQLPVAYSMARWAELNRPEFIISTGDNFYPNGVNSIRDPQWNDKWVNVYNNDSLKDLQWHISVGNHDYFVAQAELNQVDYHYQVTSRWGLPHLWYSFTKQVGNAEVLFVAIDTVAARQNVNNHTEMINWLNNVLSTSTAYWKIVFGHFPIYSTAEYGPTQVDMVNTFLPIFEQYGVDIYLCGHDHNLQHISKIGDGGIDYLISGSGGRGLYEKIDRNERLLNETYGMEVNAFYMEYGYMAFRITEAALQFDLINRDDQVLYSFTRTK